MATFGQFVRMTMHNFRMLWRPSFGASGGPLATATEETKANPMDEERAEAEANDPSQVDGMAGSMYELPAVSVNAKLDVKSRKPAVSALDGDKLELQEPLAPGPDEYAAIDHDVVSGSTVNTEADAQEFEVSASPESDAVIQGELDLENTEGLLPPDIQVESHGKRLGLTTLLESLLFVSDEPVEASQLARVLSISGKQIEAGLRRLDRLYENTARGLRVQMLEGRYQLVTAPEAANAIEDFLNLDLTTKLSGPALEALAVVAYRQPVTRVQVEAVRGVDCAGVLRSLAQRGLIEESGRLDTVGRPILYSVTDLFMQHFGLLKLGELPPLELDDEDMLWAATKLAEMEQDEG